MQQQLMLSTCPACVDSGCYQQAAQTDTHLQLGQHLLDGLVPGEAQQGSAGQGPQLVHLCSRKLHAALLQQRHEHTDAPSTPAGRPGSFILLQQLLLPGNTRAAAARCGARGCWGPWRQCAWAQLQGWYAGSWLQQIARQGRAVKKTISHCEQYCNW